jgi:hypothetical protein
MGFLANIKSYAIIAGVVAAVVGLLGWGLVIEHDKRVEAQRQVAEVNARLRAQQEAMVILDRELVASRARSQQATVIRREVYAQPQTNACVASPAVRAALGGLSRPAADSRPARGVAVPTAARDPRSAEQRR